MPCFRGQYLGTKSKKGESKKTDEQLDIYQLMLMGLKIGLQYDDFYEMNLVTLINLLTTAFEKKEKKPTQAQIDAIT